MLCWSNCLFAVLVCNRHCVQELQCWYLLCLVHKLHLMPCWHVFFSSGSHILCHVHQLPSGYILCFAGCQRQHCMLDMPNQHLLCIFGGEQRLHTVSFQQILIRHGSQRVVHVPGVEEDACDRHVTGRRKPDPAHVCHPCQRAAQVLGSQRRGAAGSGRHSVKRQCSQHDERLPSVRVAGHQQDSQADCDRPQTHLRNSGQQSGQVLGLQHAWTAWFRRCSCAWGLCQ